MCSPDAPDTSRQDAIAEKMAELNEDQFNWVKAQWEADAPNRARVQDLSNRVSQAQLDMMGEQRAVGQEAAGDYRRIYRPQEEAAAAEAASYNSVARQEQEAGKAVADVNIQAGAARGAMDRNMASMGVNVNDGAYTAGAAELANGQMLAGAAAANSARDRVQTVGRALRADSIATGRGQVSTQGTAASLAMTAGQGAVGTAAVPTSVNGQGVGMVSSAAGQASSGLGGAANIYANSSAAQAGAAEGKQAATAGLAGAAMTAAAIF